jgi:thioredoxin 1
MIKEITKNNYYDVVNNNSVTLITFKAEWCGPCKQLTPILAELSNEMVDIAIGGVNVDEEAEISVKKGIRSVPTTIFYNKGIEVLRKNGFISKSQLIDIIDNLK